jgi:hypothetical protein
MKRRPTRRLHLRATLSVTDPDKHVGEGSIRHIPVSHVDVLSIVDKEIVPFAIVRRRGASKGRRCDDAEACVSSCPLTISNLFPLSNIAIQISNECVLWL